MKNEFTIEDRFFGNYQKLICDEVIPYQRKVLGDEIPGVEKSHAIENFKAAAGLSKDGFYGMVFQDSDVAKWLEAAAYSLLLKENPELEKDMDQIVEYIAGAQQEDGYLDTYYILGNEDKKWTNLQEGHELYCAGHMMEAAVAYYEATGKTALLEVMKKNADYLYDLFGKGKKRGFPGHPEVELALVKMYETTGEKKYLELAKYFIDERGTEPNLFEEENSKRGWDIWKSDPLNREYTQNNAPVREQKDAVGHSVRGVYLYTGMAGLAKKFGEESLEAACKNLWNSITKKRMYITGGIGSTKEGEAFTADYDLPNDTDYCESCASIALIFFAKKMLDLDMDGKYVDVMERALYNTVLAGMSLDGKKFFYVNPLEVNPIYSGKILTHSHVLPERPDWYGCACCPPNIARMLSSLNRYVWSEKEGTLYSQLFIAGTYQPESMPQSKIVTKTNYPYEGQITYEVESENPIRLALRIPDWSEHTTITVNGVLVPLKVEKGYAILEGIKGSDVVVLNLDMTPRKNYSNVLVRENQNGVAIQRGPLVYCFEGVDNPVDFSAVRILQDTEITVLPFEPDTLGGITPIQVKGVVLAGEESLYSWKRPTAAREITLRGIPYYAWANRGENQMTVWLKEHLN